MGFLYLTCYKKQLASCNYKYFIHLYVRWIENANIMGLLAELYGNFLPRAWHVVGISFITRAAGPSKENLNDR